MLPSFGPSRKTSNISIIDKNIPDLKMSRDFSFNAQF